jgi:hypothetical protein
VYRPTNEWKGETGIDFVHAKQIGVRFCNKNKRHHVGRVFRRFRLQREIKKKD